MIDGGLLKLAEAAKYLGISERSLQTEVALGRVRKVCFAKPGAKKGPVRFRRCDLDEFISSHLVEPVDRSHRA